MEESESQPFFSKGTREKAAAMLKPICAMGQPPNMVELGVSSSSKWAENAVVDHRIMKLLTVQMLGRGQPASLPSVTPQKDTRSMPCCVPRVSKLHGLQRQSLAKDGGDGVGRQRWLEQPSLRRKGPTEKPAVVRQMLPSALHPTLMVLTETEKFLETREQKALSTPRNQSETSNRWGEHSSVFIGSSFMNYAFDAQSMTSSFVIGLMNFSTFCFVLCWDKCFVAQVSLWLII